MKTAIFTALVICLSTLTIETSERKTIVAPKKIQQKFDPEAHLHSKNKKKQTEKRKEARNHTEKFKERGEEHFFYRD